jgi:hypothetical protein
MSRFKGKNSIQKTSTLGISRAKYNRSAFPENGGRGPEQIVDFNFAERVLYGKVDVQHNPVIPQSGFILPIFGSTNLTQTLTAMNFVAEQFTDLEQHFVRACRMGVISNTDPILSTLQAKRAYIDPLEEYSRYIDAVMTSFVDDFLIDRDREINNFPDFINTFVQFAEVMRDIYPITLSGFQRSSQSSIFSSGLAIDIAGIPFDDDVIKTNLLLDNPAFIYYTNLAKQYGFSVNKLNPGVLISDLASPVTTVYREKVNLSTINSVFSEQFEKTLYRDFALLNNVLLEFYDTFTSRYPYIIDHECNCVRTLTTVNRKEILHDIDIYYNNIIYLYITLRNIEERKPFNDNNIQNIYKRSLSLKKYSEQKMFDYIDDQFKSKYNFQDGTLTYHKKRMKNT